MSAQEAPQEAVVTVTTRVLRCACGAPESHPNQVCPQARAEAAITWPSQTVQIRES